MRQFNEVDKAYIRELVGKAYMKGRIVGYMKGHMVGLDKAYIAGLIDGEGCICITREKYKIKEPNGNWHYQRNGSWYYQTQVIVSNTKKPLLDFIAFRYGGRVDKVKRYKSLYHCRQIYNWKATGNTMRNLLRDTLPYLIIKKEHAKIVLSFPNHQFSGRTGRTEEEMLAQEREWAKMRVLNS